MTRHLIPQHLTLTFYRIPKKVRILKNEITKTDDTNEALNETMKRLDREWEWGILLHVIQHYVMQYYRTYYRIQDKKTPTIFWMIRFLLVYLISI